MEEDKIVKKALLIGKEGLNFDDKVTGKPVSLLKLTFLLEGKEKQNEVKVFYSVKNIENTAVTLSELAKGGKGLGELVYFYKEEYSKNKGGNVYKPKFVSFTE